MDQASRATRGEQVPLADADAQSDGAPEGWEKPPPRRPMGRRSRRVLLTAAGLTVVLVGGWVLGWWTPPDREKASLTASTTVNDSRFSPGTSVFRPGKRVKAPTLEGETVGGTILQAESLRGKVVVVNVWGSWCAPCRAEAPDLARVARETESKGVRFLGIDVRDDKASAQAFTRRFDIPYQSLYDPNGTQLVKFASVIPVSAVPSTVVVDRSGRVAARVIGRVDYKTLDGLVQDVLAEIPPGSGP